MLNIATGLGLHPAESSTFCNTMAFVVRRDAQHYNEMASANCELVSTIKTALKGCNKYSITDVFKCAIYKNAPHVCAGEVKTACLKRTNRSGGPSWVSRALLLVHGGLTIGPNERTKGETSAKTDGIHAATALGGKMLSNGASAADACIAVVARLESDPLFNAGHGASLTSGGFVELDATIMDGAALRSGSVALVRRFQNPILIAASLLKGSTAALAGKAAERQAEQLGLPLVDPTDLITARSRQIFEESHRTSPAEAGTVGAVAMDEKGNLAAAISSGGIPLKSPGRLADSCMPGIGVYASNGSAAVSCTGHGETIMRLTVARDVAAICEFCNLSLQDSARKIAGRVARFGGAAAFISIDRSGEYAVASGLPDLHWGLWKSGVGISAQSNLPLDSTSAYQGIYGIFSNNSSLGVL